MTEKQVASLDRADGAAAENLFLQLLTMHNQAIVEQAEIGARNGRNPTAVTLGTQLIRTGAQRCG